MGACQSTPSPKAEAEKERSEQIDQELHEDYKKAKRECKILLLGSGESGKSTIVKQMKILHKDGFSDTERADYRIIIYRNLLESARAIINQMRIKQDNPKIKLEPEEHMDKEHEDYLDLIENCAIAPNDEKTFRLGKDIAVAISKLYRHPLYQVVMRTPSEFYLMDSAEYFFENVDRISDTAYLPSVDDVLRARQTTSGIKDMRFQMGQQLSIHMFDVGGQRSERKKWIHCFEGVTSIIFCTALSEYDQGLLEEVTRNRMLESLDLFKSVINSRWFLRTSIILFLNKIDVFKVKIHKVSLENFFKDYTGGADVNRAAKYILWRYLQLNKSRLSVYPHLTQATDTNNIKIVFAAVKETILQNALKDSGIL